MFRRAFGIALILTACTAEPGDVLISNNLPIDAGTIDSGVIDAGPIDAGPAPGAIDAGLPDEPPRLEISYSDPCECAGPRCCPSVSFDFIAGSKATHHFMCGDAIMCNRPPIGWEIFRRDGAWIRIFDPGVTAGGGFICSPQRYVDPWASSVPFPPGGVVRAVGIITDECGDDPLMCRTPCRGSYEIFSNPIDVPPEGPIDG